MENCSITYSTVFTNTDFIKTYNPQFEDLCVKILNNEYSDVSINVFNNAVYSAFRDNSVYDKLYSVLKNYVVQFRNTLCKQIIENKFRLEDFFTMYSSTLKSVMLLRANMWCMEDSTETKVKNSRINSLMLFRYLFYTEVVSHTYTRDRDLYSVINDELNNKYHNVQDILPVFDFYISYTKVCKLHNIHQSTDFMKSIGTNSVFIKNLVEYIHDIIKTKSCKKYKQIEMVIRIVEYFDDKNEFYTMYYKYLRDRLMYYKTDTKVEYKFVYMLKQSDNLVKMYSLLKDMTESNSNLTEYRKLRIIVNSEKYKNIKFDRDSTDIKIIRTDENIKFSKAVLPSELSVYTDIYENYYKQKHSNRRIIWNYMESVSVVKITINHTTYYVQMNMVQLMIVNQLNTHQNISVTQLCDNLNIKPVDTIPVLNGMLSSGLILFDETTKLVSYNEDFSHNNRKISIIHLTHTQDSSMNKGRLSMLYAVVRKLLIENPLTQDELFEEVKKCVPFNVTEDMLMDVTDKLAVVEESSYDSD